MIVNINIIDEHDLPEVGKEVYFIEEDDDNIWLGTFLGVEENRDGTKEFPFRIKENGLTSYVVVGWFKKEPFQKNFKELVKAHS